MSRIYDLSHRHQSVQDIMRWFATDHLPDSKNRDIVQSCEDLALEMIGSIPDDPELTAGLRKLKEAKDCFVCANVAATDQSDRQE